MNSSRPIILASKSPRRQQLLQAILPVFEIQTKEVDEDYPSTLQPAEVASFLAQKKAAAFREDLDETILITADTTVIHKNDILGKPCNEQEAKKMLLTLSGQVHYVNTAVCLASQDKLVVFDEVTKVYFEPLTDRVILDYITTFKPFDKAGAYGIQDCIRPGTNLLSPEEQDLMEKAREKGLYHKIMAHPDPKPPVFYIDHIEGSYFNVMGLPIVRLHRELTLF